MARRQHCWSVTHARWAGGAVPGQRHAACSVQRQQSARSPWRWQLSSFSSSASLATICRTAVLTMGALAALLCMHCWVAPVVASAFSVEAVKQCPPELRPRGTFEVEIRAMHKSGSVLTAKIAKAMTGFRRDTAGFGARDPLYVRRRCPDILRDPPHPSKPKPQDRCQVVIIRDPRDQAVSFYYSTGFVEAAGPWIQENRAKIQQMTLPEFLMSPLLPSRIGTTWDECTSWYDHVKTAEYRRAGGRFSRDLIVSYDFMLRNPELFMAALARFIGEPDDVGRKAYKALEREFEGLDEINTAKVNKQIVKKGKKLHRRSPFGGEWKTLSLDVQRHLNQTLARNIRFYEEIDYACKHGNCIN